MALVKMTEKMWRAFYKKYPDLAPDLNFRPCRKSEDKGLLCREPAIVHDLYCLFHTKQDLTQLDIPFMCQRIKKNNKRCTRFRLDDDTICHLHKVRDGDIDRARTQQATMNDKKAERQRASDKAMKSKDPNDWKSLLKWTYKEPRDAIRLCEELVNRLRWGGIKISDSKMILRIANNMIDTELKILEIKELKLEGRAAEEMKRAKDNMLKTRDQVVSLKDKIRNSMVNLEV